MEMAEVEVFAAIAAASSLSGAARRLGLSAMTVSRRLASLEQALGVRLVQRTTRSVSLTAEGEVLLPFVQTMLDADEAARATLKTHAGTASGVLKVTAPTVFGQTVILPLIPDLVADHPGLQVDLTLSDSILDIVGLGIDVAIRIATLRDSGLIARSLAPNPRVICASPAYLARLGTPLLLDDLKRHRCIGLHSMPYWPFMGREGEISFRPEPVFSANSVDTVRGASKLGLGLAMLSYWDIRSDLSDGSLVRIELTDAVAEALFIAAVLPTRQHVPSRVRIFLERLEGVLKQAEGLERL
ncbi:LysR substrate-binding domain-containing protein [Pseudomonas sp. NPDC088368]|jgi:DNA-binding transcriptional LysR family regulator|uniref:LysR family transcriptional regulator n=1 Tax=Pseudomonas sp. NPDC088368 TaxID=3364453 RepID=UPI0037FEFF2C